MTGPLRVLQLDTFPIARPVHGGQRRNAALRDAYRAAGVLTRYVAVCDQEHWKPGEWADDDIDVGDQVRAAVLRRPCLEDLLIGQLFLHDPACRARFVRTWREARPDVVQFEHPYLWAGVRRLLADGTLPPPRLVYSSQNVEVDLKADIYRTRLPGPERHEALCQVREVEEDLVRAADLVVAVSQADARRFRDMGCRRCAVVRNGGDVLEPSAAALAHWGERFRASGKAGHALFVGSPHPPNLDGFLRMAGPHQGYLPPDQAVWVVGAICVLMELSDLFRRHEGVNRSRLRLVGVVSDDDKAALLRLADAVLLPITTGGGSNLKTAEALLARKPVVATPYAFRSFEEFADLPTVHLTDDPAEFRRAVVHRLGAGRAPAQTPGGLDERLQTLTWPRLGAAFVEHVRAAV